MVLNFYKLTEQPFGVTPDPRYLYLSPTHREALASVLYGLTAGRGFTALIAQPGMGKTTILFNFLNMMRDHAKTVFLFQSQCSPTDLLRSLLADIGIEDDGSDMVRLHRKLNECLLNESRQGKRLIVVVDEAQNLEDPVLEVVRMLSNFETPREKLLHLILAGQPQLADKLASPHLVQLKQRISIIARLTPFTAAESQLYIEHRLRVAGYDFERPFLTKQAYEMIASHAQGIPRNINNICFNAMSLGCATKQRTIDTEVVKEVIGDLDLRPLFTKPETVTKFTEPKEPIRGLVSRESSQSMLRRWSIRFALTAALVVAIMSGLLMRTKQHPSNVLASANPQVVEDSKVTPNSLHVTESQKQLALSEPIAESQRADETNFVVVLPNETLYRIILKNLGQYDNRTLAMVRELNPWLTNFRRIQAGQVIRIPSTRSASRDALSTVARVPGAGTEKP